MRMDQWTRLIIVLSILAFIYAKNRKNDAGSKTAKSGKYSFINSYKNISPLKHDVFKQMSVDIVPVLIIGFLTTDQLFSIENFHNSAIGKSMLSGVGYISYYEFIQPYIVNRFFNF